MLKPTPLPLALCATLLAAGVSAFAAGIHDAVRAGDPVAVKTLLQKTPALANARDDSGQTPLHVAARAASAEMLNLLLGAGADVNAVDASGNAPLHEAAMGGHVAVVRALAQRHANLEAANLWGRTPLVLAAREMRGAAVITALLDAGARVEAVDKYGDTALTLAAWRGSQDVVTLLLARGASVPADPRKHRQVLASAASTGLADLFLRMLASGQTPADALQPDGSLLHDAAGGGAVPILAALLDRQFDAGRPDRDGWTPLHFAADMGRAAAVTFLLSKGAPLNARTRMGQSAFNLAQENNDAPMVALLAGKGADQAPAAFPELRGPYMGQRPPGLTPEVFAPGIVSGRYAPHSTIVFSPDGTEAFWSVSIPPRGTGYGTGRTLVSRLVGGRWTCPQAAVFDGIALDDVPFFHPGGQQLYDMANRALPGGQAAGVEHIWVWTRGGAGWTRPTPIDASVNRLPHHWQFSVDRAGTLYFTSNWAGHRGLFTSRLVGGRYAEPEPLGPAFGADASFPFIAPDGSYLLFARRQGLSVSFRDRDGRWGDSVSLGPEFSGILPTVSPDGKYLFYVGDERIHWVDAAVIERVRPR